MLRPMKSGWHRKARKEAQQLLNPKRDKIAWWNPISWFSVIFDTFTRGTTTYKLESGEERTTGERVSQITEEMSKVMDQKASSPGYRSIIRIVTSAGSQAEADKQIAQARAEGRRAQAIATEQEMKAKVHEMRAKVIEAEAQVPLAIADAFRQGNFGVMDYVNYKNVIADTQMREGIGKMTDGPTKQ